MSENRLSAIHIQMHQTHSGAEPFFQSLAALLAPLENATTQPNRVEFCPSFPNSALPALSVELSDSYYPTVQFDLPEEIALQAGYLILKSPTGRVEPSLVNQQFHKDPYPMPLEDLARRFSGHLVRLDHAGVELPASLVPRTAWQNLVASLAHASALYSYPTGEQWRFILPSNDEEFRSDIRDFSNRRTPKFELTYGDIPIPLFQFHIDTNLTQEEVEALTPIPYGFSLPGAKTFRSVYVAHPYRGLRIRMDLTFATRGPLSDWDSGQWLVEQGGRVR